MKTNHPFHSTRTPWARALPVAATIAVMQFSLIDLFAPPPGGDGGSTSQPSVVFDDQLDDSVTSDGGGAYRNNPKKNITVTFSNDGHLQLDTNSSNKTGVGRRLGIDFGVPITVTDRNGVNWTFQTTDEMEAAGIIHDAGLTVGAFQDNFNMLTMDLGEERTDVRLNLNLFLHFPGQSQEVPIFIALRSDITACSGADYVKVTCISVDGAGNANAWRVETQDPDNVACVRQQLSSAVYLRNLSFGFTVTR